MQSTERGNDMATSITPAPPLGDPAHTRTHQEIKDKYATWQEIKDKNKTHDEVYRKGGE
jgi:hypothetical protein